jgi:RimJ/RimL family protein N-acetyltransferase
LDDANAIFAEYAQDPDVTKYLTWRPHPEIETLKVFLQQAVADLQAGRRYFWVITLKNFDRAVGMIEARVDGHRFDFGYVLSKRCWGNGYMPEALRPIVDWALQQKEIYRIWAFCDVDNRASARVLEKIGMQREGVLRRWIVHPNMGDVPRDCFCYARIKE